MGNCSPTRKHIPLIGTFLVSFNISGIQHEIFQIVVVLVFKSSISYVLLISESFKGDV